MRRCECIPIDNYKIKIELNDFNEDGSGLNVDLIGEGGTFNINFGYVTGFRREKVECYLDGGLYIAENRDEFIDVMKKWMGDMYDDRQKEYLIVGENYLLLVLSEWELEIKTL